MELFFFGIFYGYKTSTKKAENGFWKRKTFKSALSGCSYCCEFFEYKFPNFSTTVHSQKVSKFDEYWLKSNSLRSSLFNHSQKHSENFHFRLEKNWAARKFVNQPKRCMVKCRTVVFKLRNCFEFDGVVRRRKFYFLNHKWVLVSVNLFWELSQFNVADRFRVSAFQKRKFACERPFCPSEFPGGI